MLADLLLHTAQRAPEHIALLQQQTTIRYQQLAHNVSCCASGLQDNGVRVNDRVAVYLNKSIEHITALFAASLAGAIIVPINPLLKAQQVAHILQDSAARTLITSADRLPRLTQMLSAHPNCTPIVINAQAEHADLNWRDISLCAPRSEYPHRQPEDPCAIIYTSGSTGKAKGVVLSHANITLGADSVRQYLRIQSSDRLLAVLPLHFDYGFNQITSAFLTGGSVVLMEYLFAKDVLRAIEKYHITGLAGVPPLLTQLAQLAWPADCSLRYISNSGGHLSATVVQHLLQKLPNTELFLMYGLTESFRSTYLPPALTRSKPDSVGQAVPNAEVFILRPDGGVCAPNEIGELVHRGPLVALGYWRNSAETNKRFRPLPTHITSDASELAVWSGDLAKMDATGDIIIVGRIDDQIKVSGYRISPTEVEETLYRHPNVCEAVVFAVPHPTLSAGIIAAVTVTAAVATKDIARHCQGELPNFMLPQAIKILTELPKTSTGKFDRKQLKQTYHTLFMES